MPDHSNLVITLRIEAGETIALARRGEVVAELRPASSTGKRSGKRKLGFLSHLGPLPDNFEEIDKALDREIERSFEDSKIFPE